jgi:antitoxin (DNA-binding transcriptional repressor) of toxin-antitoxin stability system
MKIATVRDLRYDFPKIESWLAGGEEILITKHSRPIARLCAANGTAEPALPPLPDFQARLKKTWGDRFFTQQEVEEMRAFETGEP